MRRRSPLFLRSDRLSSSIAEENRFVREGLPEAARSGATADPVVAAEEIVAQMIELAVPKALGVTEETYRLSLSRPAWDHDGAVLGFHLLILVEPRVNFWIQVQHANVANYLSDAVLPDPGSSLDTAPFWLQVDAGTRHLGRSVKEAEAALLSGERGLTALEGVSLVLQHPQLLAARCLDLPGSRTTAGEVPCFGVWYNRVGLFARRDDIASPIYGAATCLVREPAVKVG